METALWKDGGGERWGGGGEYEAPPNSPKNNLQLWMNTLSQSNLNAVDARMFMCRCVLEAVEC